MDRQENHGNTDGTHCIVLLTMRGWVGNGRKTKLIFFLLFIHLNPRTAYSYLNCTLLSVAVCKLHWKTIIFSVYRIDALVDPTRVSSKTLCIELSQA